MNRVAPKRLGTILKGEAQEDTKRDCIGVVICRQLQRKQRLNVFVSLVAGFYAGANLAFGTLQVAWPPCHGVIVGEPPAHCKTRETITFIAKCEFFLMFVFNIANLIALTSSPRGQGGVGFQRRPLKLAVMMNILLSVSALALALCSLEMWESLCDYLTYMNEVSVFICGYEMLLIVATDALENNSPVPRLPGQAKRFQNKYPSKHYVIVVMLFLWLRLQFINGKFFLATAAISLFVFSLDNLLICDKLMATAGQLMCNIKQAQDDTTSTYIMPELFKLRRTAVANVWVGIFSAMYCSTAFWYGMYLFLTQAVCVVAGDTGQDICAPPNHSSGLSSCSWLSDCESFGVPVAHQYPNTSTGACAEYYQGPGMIQHHLTPVDLVEFSVAFLFNIMMLIAVTGQTEHGGRVHGNWIKAWMMFNMLGSFSWLSMGLAGIRQVDASGLFAFFGAPCQTILMDLWGFQRFNEYVVVYPFLYYVIRECLAHASMNNLIPLRVMSVETQHDWAKKTGRRGYFLGISVVWLGLKALCDHYVLCSHETFLFVAGLLLFFFSLRNWIISEEIMREKSEECRGWAHHLALAVETTRRKRILVILSMFACVFCACNLALGVLNHSHVFMSTPYAPWLEILSVLLFNIVNVFALTFDPGQFANGEGTGKLAEGSLGKFMSAVFFLLFFACSNFLAAFMVQPDENMAVASNPSDFLRWQNGTDGVNTNIADNISTMTHVRWLSYINLIFICGVWIYAWGFNQVVLGKNSATPYVTVAVAVIAGIALRGGHAIGVVAGFILFNFTMEGFQETEREVDDDASVRKVASIKNIQAGRP